jgi:hypothetical protein
MIVSACGGTVVERTPPAPDAGTRNGGSIVRNDTSGLGGAVGNVPNGVVGGGPVGDYGSGGATGLWGAAGGISGVGGSEPAVPAPPKCVPRESIACACTDGHPGAQVCGLDGTYAPCVCRTTSDGGSWEQQQLARLRQGVVGTWVGTQTNPWQAKSCPTTVTFDESGHYAAHSPDEACIVFYYGSNDDSPEKIYDLNDVQADGKGSGSLAVYFAPGDVSVGVLHHVVLTDDQNQLSFDCTKDGYGPLVFSLTRQGF